MAQDVTTRERGDDAPPKSLTAVCDIPPATGKPCASPVAMFAAPELLLRVDVIAMLLRKAASDRNRFAVSQHEAGERYRDEGRDVGCMNFRDRDLGHGEYGSSNNDKHRRSAGKQPCKKDQGCDCRSPKTSVGICVSWSDQTTWPMRSNGEADVAAGNADDADHQRNCRREGQGPRKIAVGHGHDAGGNHERHCRCRSDRQLAARSKYRVGNSRHEIAIEAGDRRKLRQRRVGEGLRNDEGASDSPAIRSRRTLCRVCARIQWDAGNQAKPVSRVFSLMPPAPLTHVYWPRPIFLIC